MQHPVREYMADCIERATSVHGVGSLLVHDDDIIATSTGAVTDRPDATAHAEVEVLRSGCRELDAKHLTDAWLYTTHEPCPMCAAAACWARVDGIVFAARQTDMPDHWASEFPDTTIEDIISAATHPPVLHPEFMRGATDAIHRSS